MSYRRNSLLDTYPKACQIKGNIVDEAFGVSGSTDHALVFLNPVVAVFDKAGSDDWICAR